MYGLPQAGLLANKLLEKHLNKHGDTDKASWYLAFGNMTQD
jgi:hypothetical protein